MKSGTNTLIGLSIMIAGGWIVDSAVQNRGPIQALEALIKDPTNPESVLSGHGSQYPSEYPTNPGSGRPPGQENPRGNIGEVIAYWHSKIGDPYVFGAEGPNAFDCSGLMWAGYQSIGVTIPRTTAAMLISRQLQKVTSLANCLPGDIIFPYPGHCFGYIGGGQMIEAPHTGEYVHQAKVYKFWTARRVLS